MPDWLSISGVTGAGVVEPQRNGALAEALTDLKARSGCSYEQIAQQAHLGRSTVHRYCSGKSVPAEFASIEHIARACGADREELSRLHQLWSRQDPVRGKAGGGLKARPAQRWRLWLPVAVSAAAALIITFTFFPGDADTPDEPASFPITAPSWTNAPSPVSPEFVGVTRNSDTGLMPGFPVGSFRLWNSATTWQDLEPERGRFNWRGLDTLLASAESRGVPVVLTFGDTPGWAAPNGRLGPEGDGSRSNPPDDLADWDRFVRAVVSHADGRIESYEVWDIGTQPYFNGTPETLVEMTRIASDSIRELDPKANVICPGFTDLWNPDGRSWLRRFTELGGYDHCDYGAVKLNQRSAADPPETIIELSSMIDVTLHQGWGGTKLWNTGWGPEVLQQQRLDPEVAADHAVRYYLASLWSSFDRVYFYNWGSDRLPIVLQPRGFAPTKAGRFVGELQRWLTGAEITSCGQGRRAGLPDNVWQCRFLRADKPFWIQWTHDGTANLLPEPGATRIRYLDGTSANVDPAKPLSVTTRPVLLETPPAF